MKSPSGKFLPTAVRHRINLALRNNLSILSLALRRFCTLRSETRAFGKRFAPRVEFIRGITIHDEERMFANNLAIVNYIVTTNSKYSANIASFTEKFDFIVDNNPSTFACCLFHFCTMLISYKKLLRDGGEILTAEPGLSCEGSTGDPNWSLRWSDWAYLGEVLAMPTRRLTEDVYSMHRRSATMAE